MSEILPAEALLPMRQYLTFVGRNTEPHEVQPNSPFDMIRRLVDSHEALRARLTAAEERAEQLSQQVAGLLSELRAAEGERDRWHAAYEEEVEVGGARLVEAVELLRALMACHDYLGDLAGTSDCTASTAARVFIEEQGQVG